MWIAVYKIMYLRLDAHTFQTLTEVVGGMLSVVVGDDHRTHHETAPDELVAQAQHILVVGDAQVGTHFVALYILSAYHYHDLYLVANLAEHTQFGVGLKPWQHAAGVMVVKEFAAQFQVQFALELSYTFLNVFRLYAEILVVVKSYFHWFIGFFVGR